jgi:hypothetical protein
MTTSTDADAEPVFVDMLTDEEVSVVAPPGAMPVLPFLSGLSDAHKQTAQRTAYRSLVARGILTPPTPEALADATARRDGSVDVMLRQDIRSVVALREGARLIVAVARTTAASQDYWYAHLVDDVILLEEVSRDGYHRFALAHSDRLEALAVGAAVHPDAGDATGEPLPVESSPEDPTPPDGVLEQLGEALVRSDIVVRRPGDSEPPAFALFTGPGGSWIVDPRSPGPRAAVPLTSDAARARVADAVAGVRAEMEVLGG